MPSCAACSSVYGTECVYDPNSDHRRKGVYKEKIDSLKTRSSTLQTLIQAILNAAEDDVQALVRQIRTCESLDVVADNILRQEHGLEDEEDDNDDSYTSTSLPTFETELSGKMGELRLENGSVRFLGGTSNLIYLDPADENENEGAVTSDAYQQQEDPLSSWTTVTRDSSVIVHLINMYFTWHYPYFTTLSKSLFYRDFLLGKPHGTPKRMTYCSSLLVNAMLALGCHFTNSPAGCADPRDASTKGDAFFAEAKRLIVDNDEYEKPRLTTIQALCLMSVREAGCGREAKGWVYSGMSFRMAQDMGLNLDSGGMTNHKETMDELEIDARRITFWGCFLFDKCWSNYLGRLPQLPVSNITVPKYDVFPEEDSDIWSPYTDNGIGQQHSQPSRTRAVALQISGLCEISSDILIFFYNPQQLEKSAGRAQELKKLSELQTRLEAWRKELPKELEPKEGQLPNVLLMHMFFHLLYIHLFRPFLKYNPTTSPLPSHVSPRKLCTQAAGSVSKLMRLYKRTYGLRQICNIAVYIVHSACTIHLLTLPEKTAKRDIIHGVKHLEEIAEDWLCARRTLSILSVLARKWKIELPEEASSVFARTDAKYGTFSTADVPSPKAELVTNNITPPPVTSSSLTLTQAQHAQHENQLKQSLYSYLPDSQSTTSNGQRDMAAQTIPRFQMKQPLSPVQQFKPDPSAVIGPMAVPNNSLVSPVPYVPYNISSATSTSTFSPTKDHARAESHITSEPTSTRQISPSTLFGGVDALVESQDWWLRDQANLATGFDNWMSGDQNSASHGLNGTDGNLGDLDQMTGLGSSFYMPLNGNRGNDAYMDDDWNAYT
ncbi:Nitrogen assimilation transcription factor nit-4 [Hyphodiscus hymeniophilus]|uniref:Nitrogen assimilation transcription factor nit-4 n=1 Tax=Hyphodiscus hymeniophilus TaxID=353542 RepID=A0A9P6VSM3_9HELO|nr:Nitrogen assimilation transcription factor nit-4 [Hyphodiscus hymeniophilus]